MRILVLGAHGFLGQHVYEHLAGQVGFTVVAGPRSHELDLSRAAHGTWRDLLGRAAPEAVVNCAGRTQGGPEELRAANVTLVYNLIEAAEACARPPWIVHFGSAAEYGPQVQLVSEDTPARPASPYGQSKLAATQALLDARERLPVTVLRVCNPIGKGQSSQTLTGRAALEFRQAVQRGDGEVAFGDLSAGRDFVDARDVARAVEAVLRAGPLEALLNVGLGVATRARSLVEELARLASYAGRISERADGSARSAQVAWQHADVSRLRQLGWRPLYTLEDALGALWKDASDPSCTRLSLT